MRTIGCVGAIALVISGCAGRDAQPVAIAQIQDFSASCGQINAEIQANNVKIQELADEQGMKTAQNVAAGVVGIVVWPIWFGMDFKGAASKDLAALQARQQYLAQLALERCAQSPQRRPR